MKCRDVSWKVRGGKPAWTFLPLTQEFKRSMQKGEVWMSWMIGWLFDVEFFRLKEELEILRKMFKEHMRVSEEHLEMTYKKEAKEQ